MKKENITNPTPEQIEKWKKLYGESNVKHLAIELKFKTADGEEFDERSDAEEHVESFKADMRTIEVTEKAECWLRTPDRKVIGMATSVAGKDTVKFGELIMKNCWLGGDERIMNDDDLFLSANSILGDIIKIRTATLKNC
jgi:hypothetical protein